MDIAAAALPGIRFRRSAAGPSDVALDDVGGRGLECLFAIECGWVFGGGVFISPGGCMRRSGVPVGVIDSSRGGTPIEPFIPRAAFVGHPTLEKEGMLGDAGDLRGIFLLEGGVQARDANWLPGRLFNSRVAPLAKFVTRGDDLGTRRSRTVGGRRTPRDYAVKMRAVDQRVAASVGG